MKGSSCFQEDELDVQRVEPGTTGRSKSFIRESQLFDRVEWGEEVEVIADLPIPREAVSFRGKLPRSSSFPWIGIGTAVGFVILLWFMLAR
jgi:hypothetical protein